MYSGIAFSLGRPHLYVSLDSLTAPEGGDAKHTGNAIAVYSFANGVLTPERLIPIPLQHLAPGRTQNQIGKPLARGSRDSGSYWTCGGEKRGRKGADCLWRTSFPTTFCLSMPRRGRSRRRFDLADHPIVPSAYPIAVIATKDGSRAFVALWNGSAVAELDLRAGKIDGQAASAAAFGRIRPSSHPIALALSPDEKMLYVALANRDLVAGVKLGGKAMQLVRLYEPRLPGQTYFGAMPDSVALSDDGAMLYAANSGYGLDCRLPYQAGKPGGCAREADRLHPDGVVSDGSSGEGEQALCGHGEGPRDWTRMALRRQSRAVPPAELSTAHEGGPHTYIATLLHGSLASIDRAEAEKDLPALTKQVMASNMMEAAQKSCGVHDGWQPHPSRDLHHPGEPDLRSDTSAIWARATAILP